ncbi:colony stimulating factor 3 (granulocyte) a [Polymixia lowei]
MAMFLHSAPLPDSVGQTNTLVEDREFHDMMMGSQSLTQKILLAIPETHKSCIHTATLQINSPENGMFVVMAANIGIPSAPVLKILSENFTLVTSLRRMSEGLQLHRSLLKAVLPRLENRERVTELLADTRDLLLQIHKMLRMIQAEPTALPTVPSVVLRLPGEYEVQVGTHLTLVQLQAFGKDMMRTLRSFSQDAEPQMES